MRVWIAALLALAASPAAAQHRDHGDMAMPAAQAEDAPAQENGASDDAASMDHGQMDHGEMQQGTVQHDQAMSADAVPTTETPPPAAAGSGPARAADAVWGAEEMAASRRQLAYENGGQQRFWFMADRAEYRAHDGKDGYLWDLQGSYGGDIDKFFYKSEGEGNFDGPIERVEVQALYDHAIGPFFDLQTGIWGADAMAASRRQLIRENGGQRRFWFMADRAEFRAREGRDGYLWDLQGSYGGDIDKFFYKSEGEGSFGTPIERAEVQALYDHAIGPFFDLQAGIRQDFAPRDRTYAVIGVQGLAPYRFEIDSALFLSDQGDLTARAGGGDRPADHPAPDPATAHRGQSGGAGCARAGHRRRGRPDRGRAAAALRDRPRIRALCRGRAGMAAGEERGLCARRWR